MRIKSVCLAALGLLTLSALPGCAVAEFANAGVKRVGLFLGETGEYAGEVSYALYEGDEKRAEAVFPLACRLMIERRQAANAAIDAESAHALELSAAEASAVCYAKVDELIDQGRLYTLYNEEAVPEV